MNQWANTVLTDKGAALLAKLTQGNTLHITRAATGEGFVTPGMLTKQTEITGHKQDLEFKKVTYPENGKCAIPVSLKNDELVAGYEVTQVGLYATDPDDGEILLIISQAPDANSGTIVPSATEMPGYSAEWTFYLQYGQADGVNVTVSPSNTVTFEDMTGYVNDAIKNKSNVGHSHSADDIGSGTFSSDRLPVVPILKGGTGATSADKARENLGITPENIGAATPAHVSVEVNTHNTAGDAHNDIRLLVEGIATRLNALANSDDTTLDQMAEVVEYIKDNRDLIEQITTGKVSVSDIVDNLTTNVANKPLSAAQGMALKTLIDALQTAINSKAPASHTQAASTVTSGTLAGAVKANAEAAEVVSYAQVRDISAGTGDMEAGSTPLATGSLYFVYE